MKLVKKIDDLLIDATQRAYLWLYDWTGVYVGTVTFVMCVTIVILYEVRGRPVIWVDFLFLGINGIWSCVAYLWQSTDRVDEFNSSADMRRTSIGRVVLNGSITVFLTMAIVDMNLLAVVSEFVWVALSYMIVVKIRKREPKNFWEHKLMGARR